MASCSNKYKVLRYVLLPEMDAVHGCELPESYVLDQNPSGKQTFAFVRLTIGAEASNILTDDCATGGEMSCQLNDTAGACNLNVMISQYAWLNAATTNNGELI